MATEGVKLELAGQVHELRLTRRALYRLETETDRTIVEVLDRVQRGSYAAMCDLVWAGLSWKNSRLTPEDIAELLDGADMAVVAKAIVDSMAQLGGKSGNAQSDTSSTSESGLSVSPPESTPTSTGS